MIRIHRWDEASRTCERGGVELLPPPSAIPDALWIDLEDPTPEEEALILRQFYPIHTLSLEDITYTRNHPGDHPHLSKVEEFPDYLLVIVNPLHPTALKLIREEIESTSHHYITVQLSAVFTDKILITHHYQQLASIDELILFLRKHETQLGRGPDYLFHLVLDVMVDEYAPLLDKVDDSLDNLEVQVFSQPSSNLLSQLLSLKHGVIAMRKTMIYEREVLARLARGDFELINQREMAYYRNVYDHLLRFSDLMEASREMVTDLMQTLLASQANKLNEIMKVLTMISTTVLPMTLIAGIYGMNFELNVWPDFKNASYGFPLVIGLMLCAGGVASLFFRWMKWI
ncbi:MAG: magnesium/cobalt transporter CorA [Gemmataceae bacterium]